MKNIVVATKGKVIRMKEENKLMLSSIICSSPFAVITGEKDGRKFRFQLLAEGAKWVEVK